MEKTTHITIVGRTGSQCLRQSPNSLDSKHVEKRNLGPLKEDNEETRLSGCSLADSNQNTNYQSCSARNSGDLSGRGSACSEDPAKCGYPEDLRTGRVRRDSSRTPYLRNGDLHSSGSVASHSYASSRGASGSHNMKVKVILLGDAGVGKSTFLQTLVNDRYTPARQDINLSMARVLKTVQYDGKPVELEIRDTAGQEKYRSMTASFYRNIHACLVFFNVYNSLSFKNVGVWLEDIKTYCASSPPAIVLVGLLHDFSNPTRNPSTTTDLGSDSNIGDNIITTDDHPHHQNHNYDNNIVYRNDDDDDDDREVDHYNPDRAVQRAQAMHMATTWQVAYREVDSQFDPNSVMEAVHTLLDCVLLKYVPHTIMSQSIKPTLQSSKSETIHLQRRCCCLPC